MNRKNNKGREILFILIVWAVLFLLLPLTVVSLNSKNGLGDVMHQTFNVWIGILPYFILYLLHHFLLAPLFYRKQGFAYFSVTILLIVLMGIFIFNDPVKTDLDRGPRPEPSEMTNQYRPAMPGDMQGPPPDIQRPPQFNQSLPPEMDNGILHRFSIPLSPQYMKLFLAILICGFDLGLISYFKGIDNEKHMQELKTENLKSHLEALRYQINPHFFMNTLNNIHALVDLDPSKAKESIEQFSKLMRIVLYGGNTPTIPLSMELDYINQYISLMRLRYPEDKVTIETHYPSTVQDIQIPPLVLASFIENAFKHGISYDEQSFVRIYVDCEDSKLFFKCVNTNHPTRKHVTDDSHGLGIENVRKRLDLIYGDKYALHIENRVSTYETVLVLPDKPINISA